MKKLDVYFWAWWKNSLIFNFNFLLLKKRWFTNMLWLSCPVYYTKLSFLSEFNKYCILYNISFFLYIYFIDLSCVDWMNFDAGHEIYRKSLNNLLLVDNRNIQTKRFSIFCRLYSLYQVKIDFFFCFYIIYGVLQEYKLFFLCNSLSNIFCGSKWVEREIFDLFGIFFKNNTDLRRILTDYGFFGYPLRKDFPTVGFEEVLYDFELEKVIYVPISLSQSPRFFENFGVWTSRGGVMQDSFLSSFSNITLFAN